MKLSLPWRNESEPPWMDPDAWPIENADTVSHVDETVAKPRLETILATAQKADIDVGALLEIAIATEEHRELPEDIPRDLRDELEAFGIDGERDDVTQAVSSLIDFIVARELLDSGRPDDDVVDELHALTEIHRGESEAYFDRIEELLESTTGQTTDRASAVDSQELTQTNEADQTDSSVSVGILPVDLAWFAGGISYGTLDMFSTALVLGNGGQELNPVFDILGGSLPAFVAWKTIVLLALFVLFYPDNREEPTALDWAVPILLTVVGVILTANNLLVLSGRGFIG
jgi:hypothetical protein